MPTPIAPRIIVSQTARTDLPAVVRAQSTPPSLALRARLVLRAAELDRPSPRPIGHEVGGATLTVGQWRRRSMALGCAGLHDALRSGRPRTMASPRRVQVLAVARTWPHAQDRTVSRWPFEAIVAPWLDALPTDALSRARLWRLLHDVDLQPHKRAYGLNRPAEDFEATAHPMCPLDIKALDSYSHGRLGIGCDEKTGRPGWERNAPPNPAQPGRRERRDHEDIRPGTRVLIHSLAVATGQMAWTIGRTRTAPDFVTPLHQTCQRLPRMTRDAWVLDNVNPHGRLDVCRGGARWGQVPCEPPKRKKGPQRRAFLRDPRHRHVLHCTPKHGAWRKQAAWFFGVLPRRFLARGSFPRAQDLERRLERFVKQYPPCHAHPYRWTYTGEP